MHRKSSVQALDISMYKKAFLRIRIINTIDDILFRF